MELGNEIQTHLTQLWVECGSITVKGEKVIPLSLREIGAEMEKRAVPFPKTRSGASEWVNRYGFRSVGQSTTLSGLKVKPKIVINEDPQAYLDIKEVSIDRSVKNKHRRAVGRWIIIALKTTDKVYVQLTKRRSLTHQVERFLTSIEWSKSDLLFVDKELNFLQQLGYAITNSPVGVWHPLRSDVERWFGSLVNNVYRKLQLLRKSLKLTKRQLLNQPYLTVNCYLNTLLLMEGVEIIGLEETLDLLNQLLLSQKEGEPKVTTPIANK